MRLGRGRQRLASVPNGRYTAENSPFWRSSTQAPPPDHVRTFVTSNALPGDLMYEKILEAGRSPFSHTLLFPLCQVRDWPSTSNDAFYSGAMSYLMEFRLRPDPIAPRKTLTNHAFRGSWSGWRACSIAASEGLTEKLLSGFSRRILPGTG